MSKLFDYKDVKVSTSRNGFDNAGKRAFTAKVGELLPIWWTRLIPGDTVQGTVQHFTRTRPVNSPAFTRIREYFDFVVVPIDQLWKSFPTAVTLMQENNLQAVSMDENLQVTDQMPYLTLNQLVSLKTGSSSVLHKLSGGDPFNPQYYKKNYFGFNRMFLTCKLFSYLRYCRIYDDIFNQNFVSQVIHDEGDVIRWSFPVDIFPLLAYQKAYNDLYRHSQWESANPFTWNVDYSSGGQLTLPVSGSASNNYWNNNTMFDLRYANFNKDLFMGLLPESQFGDVASIDMQFNLSSIPLSLDVTGTATFTNGQLQGNVSESDGTAPQFKRLGIKSMSDGFGLYTNTGDTVSASDTSTNLKVTGSVNLSNLVASGQIDSSGFAASYSILALRMQEALQRWKEVAQCGNQDYRDQVYRQFGVTLPDELSGLAEFVGGDASNLNIDEVVNQNLSEGNSTDIQGKGVGVGQFNVNYTAKRHSIMLCIYHAVPLLDYDISGIDKKLFATSAYDYPIPAFDKIGFEELSLACFTNAGYRVTGYDDEGKPTYYHTLVDLPDEPITMGYVPRYVEQKTDIDVVLGDFAVSTKNWVAPVNDDYLFENLTGQQYDINYNFFKVNPHILDPIFAVAADSSVKTDQLLVNSYLDIKKVSNLDYNGLPY